jgi:hypothetical protein
LSVTTTLGSPYRDICFLKKGLAAFVLRRRCPRISSTSLLASMALYKQWLTPFDHNDDLVQMPFVLGLWSIALDAACEIRPKPFDSEPHSFAAHYNAVFGQKILDIRCAQRETVRDPDRTAMISRG